MRKLDLLIIRAFIGPFLLTTALSTFILLIQHMLKYFDDFVGKDLGFLVFAKLLFYFSLNMLQIALPLGVLVSSIMTFGTLGEHFELTAIKSAGISLIRALRPIFIFVLFISIGAFFFNDNVLPSANLKAYSLLYDIKHKKPTLDIQEGVFYKGIPNYIIKAKEKFPDDITLKDVIIYDHTNMVGNKRVIRADSSRMYLFMNDRYLKLELYDGFYYVETPVENNQIDQFQRTAYDRLEMLFSLASFEFDPTDEDLFRGNRQMMKIPELTYAIDSMEARAINLKNSSLSTISRFFRYKDDFKIFEEEKDSLKLPPSFMENDKTFMESPLSKQRRTVPDSLSFEELDSIIFSKKVKRKPLVTGALQQARNIKNNLHSTETRISDLSSNMNRYKLEKYKKFSQAFACIVMFLIGAPLGAIIKKGGLGVPVIISVFFFIIYYVLSNSGEEYAKADVMDGQYAVWTANICLLPVGLFFLRQARIDARLFDKDIYIIWFDKNIAKYWPRKKIG